jgi:cytochrome P450
MQLVYNETARQVSQMMESWESNMENGVTIIEKCSPILLINGSIHKDTMKIALHVITAAGYGYPFEWEASAEVPPGHQMSFRESIHVTLDNLVTLAAVPRLLLKLPIKSFRRTEQAYNEFAKYLQGLIDIGKRRQPSKSKSLNNILQTLIQHSGETPEDVKGRVLRDDEIIGNAFIFLLAGHETT